MTLPTYAPSNGAMLKCQDCTGDYVTIEEYKALYNKVTKLLEDFGNLDADIAEDIAELKKYVDFYEVK